MEEKKISYEEINTSEITNVQFCTWIDKGNYAPYHWHRAIEIVYVLEGELLVTAENHSKLLLPGRCALINMNVIHSNKATKPDKYILLQIPVDFLKKFIPNVQELKFVVNDGLEEKAKQNKIEQLKKILEKMKELDDNRSEGFLLYFNCLLFELLCLMHGSFSEKIYQADMVRKKRDFARLNKIMDYVAKNYRRNIPLEEIAKVALFEPKYFCRFFKKHMGITFLEYQNELRLSYIYRDLINTEDLVAEILERHGFSNYKLFRRMFKVRFGDTPLKVRARLKN